jgi:hypothetical protein
VSAPCTNSSALCTLVLSLLPQPASARSAAHSEILRPCRNLLRSLCAPYCDSAWLPATRCGHDFSRGHRTLRSPSREVRTRSTFWPMNPFPFPLSLGPSITIVGRSLVLCCALVRLFCDPAGAFLHLQLATSHPIEVQPSFRDHLISRLCQSSPLLYSSARSLPASDYFAF